MFAFMSRFARDQKGASALEYGILAALIAVAIIAGATVAGDQINTLFDNVGTQIQNVNTESATNAPAAPGT